MRVCVCVNTLTVSIVIYCKVWRNLHDMTLMMIMMLLGTSFINHMENQMKGLESDIENIRIPWRVDGLGVQKYQVVEGLQQVLAYCVHPPIRQHVGPMTVAMQGI